MQLNDSLCALALSLTLVAGLSFPQSGIGDDSDDARPIVKAFLVGTDDYDVVNDLSGCANDVDSFKEVLGRLEVDLKVVALTSRASADPSRKAGKAKIEAHFDKFLDGLTSEDIAIVMFSGHGCQISDEQGILRTYYAPWDCVAEGIGDNTKLDEKTLFNLSDAVRRFSRSPARFKWMIIDACRDDKERLEETSEKKVVILPKGWNEENPKDAIDESAKNFLLSQSCAGGQTSQEEFYNGSQVKRGAYMLSLCKAMTDERYAKLEGNKRTIYFEDASRETRTIIKTLEPRPSQTPSESESDLSENSAFQIKSVQSANLQDVGVEFVWAPQGDFSIGSNARKKFHVDGGVKNEDPQIKVKITRGFWLARTETTNELWARVMDEKLEKGVDPRTPVVGKSWEEIQEFVRRANDDEAFKRQFGDPNFEGELIVSLPTEAEWERACRAGETGEVPREIDGELREVGTNESDVNSWGFRDMFGNVREWCLDCYEDYSAVSENDAERVNRIGRRDRGLRVVRGSGFASPGEARATQREGVDKDASLPDVGFRVALVRKNP